MAARCCVLHPHQPAAHVCIVGQRGRVRDFCADCIKAGRDEDNFGRCYLCSTGDHDLYIGVPCQCECDGPTDVGKLDSQIAAVEFTLSELKAKRAAATS